MFHNTYISLVIYMYLVYKTVTVSMSKRQFYNFPIEWQTYCKIIEQMYSQAWASIRKYLGPHLTQKQASFLRVNHTPTPTIRKQFQYQTTVQYVKPKCGDNPRLKQKYRLLNGDTWVVSYGCTKQKTIILFPSKIKCIHLINSLFSLNKLFNIFLLYDFI